MALSPKREQEAIERLRSDGMLLKRYAKHNITRNMSLAAVQRNGRALQCVPDALRDREMCLAAVRQNGWALKYVPEELRDREMCMAAVQQNSGLPLKYVPEKLLDQKICQAAVQQHSWAFQYVPTEVRGDAATAEEFLAQSEEAEEEFERPSM